MYYQDIKLPKATGGRKFNKKNSLPQANKAGGYIARMLLMNGVFVQREKTNYATDALFVKKVKQITDNTGHCMEVLQDARFDIYDATGTIVVLVIGCSNRKAMELV